MNKLVRDKIPQIIESSGKTCRTRILNKEEYIQYLEAKLNEELSKYQQSKEAEELADLLEVMEALVRAKGWSWDQLTALQAQKEPPAAASMTGSYSLMSIKNRS